MSTARLDKKKVIELFVEKLGEEIEVLTQAARAAHEAATHAESVAEDAHDTRGLEASYLAGAQAQRAVDLKRQIQIFRQLPARDFAPESSIEIGALVTLSLGSRLSYHLLVPAGGGLNVKLDGVSVQALTPSSPLGDALLGKTEGESVELESAGVSREYEVVRIV